MGNAAASPLQQLIIERIQREGPLPFSEYMRMALYEPGYGYYVSGAAKLGWEGDYFTSTDVSAFFAHCMGRQLFVMWEKLKKPDPFLIVEEGAGRGHLAEGIRVWAEKEVPEFLRVLDYRVEDIRAGQDVLEGEGNVGAGVGEQGGGKPGPYHTRP
ncbi:MAG TPA: SAM-dependent methyltransferase, partial [Ktedonobacteraceae bacterium]|nr:SAM-dependent methyltransferase [Ktedonobacteraceae bacterium]